MVTWEQTSVGAAYHEAAHAVARLALGLEFERIVFNDHRAMVYVRHKPIHVRDLALVVCAGPMAHYRYVFTGEEYERHWQEWVDGVSHLDVAEALLWMRLEEDDKVVPDDDMKLAQVPEYARDDSLAEAEELLDENWPAIKRLAAALLERGVVTYGEAVEIAGELTWRRAFIPV